MNSPKVVNPNDFKVVSFHNSTDFGFTHAMGCMYDGRGISGRTAFQGIEAGEELTLPYHIGHRLATNLAKAVMLRMAPTVDAVGVPTGVPLWDTAKLESLKNSFLKELYSEAKPVAESETDKLMKKVEEYKALVEKVLKDGVAPKGEVTVEVKTESAEGVTITPEETTTTAPTVFQDKAEVIAELTKRNIKFDARKNKADLETLLA